MRGILIWIVSIFIILSPTTLIFISLSTEPVSASTAYDYDVVIVGAGTGGISAAIQAARMGAKVALLEETDWIGGQMTTAGVAALDGGAYILSGITQEFVTRISYYYQTRGKSVSTCYMSTFSFCFEPSVGQKIIYDMIAETRSRQLPNGENPVLDIYLRRKVGSVSVSGGKVTGIVTDKGDTFNSKILVDATEYGDLLSMIPGLSYRTGKSTSENINLSDCVQDITYVAIIKKYPNGVPSELWMQNPPPGYNNDVIYQFSILVATNGINITQWNWTWNQPMNWALHNSYRGVPDSSNPNSYTSMDSDNITKTGVNAPNDYPSTRPYNKYYNNPTLSVRYLEDSDYRKAINCEAKLKTLQFIYYAQHELNETLWSIANDEGYNTSYNIEENLCSNIPQEFKEIEKHFPLIPYVREGRRLIGIKTLVAQEINRSGEFPRQFPAKTFTSASAIGDYHTDMHNCFRINTIESSLEYHSGGYPGNEFGGGPFQVPFEVFIPKTTDGFLVAEKSLSQSRITNGATRLHPITMLTGQAVGALAALAVKSNIEPRWVKPIKVQKVLLDEKHDLSVYYFNDVNSPFSLRNHEFWPYIQLVSLYNIMNGYDDNTFRPDETVLRRHAAVVLVKRFNISVSNPPSTPTFADVPSSDPHYAYIEAIYRAGITTGCASNPLRFCPNVNSTRAEFAVLLAKAMKLDLFSTPQQQIFEDVPSSHWAFPYIQILAQKNITHLCSESPKRFCPDSAISRGQAAYFLANSLILQPIGNSDLNRDEKTDIQDLVIITSNFGKTVSTESAMDVIQNGEIDIYDVVFVASRFA